MSGESKGGFELLDEQNQRTCPCKSVIKLAADVQGIFNVVRSEMTHLKDEQQHQVETAKELNIQVGDCLRSIAVASESIKASAERMNAGEARFQAQDDAAAEIPNTIKKAVVEHAAEGHKVLNVIVGILCLTNSAMMATLVLTGHATELIEMMTKIGPIG